MFEHQLNSLHQQRDEKRKQRRRQRRIVIHEKRKFEPAWMSSLASIDSSMVCDLIKAMSRDDDPELREQATESLQFFCKS